jgi:hypothetical protein
VLDPDDPAKLRRLSDLTRVQPTDDTLKNLLGMLTAKLELCSQLPFIAYQADREGFERVAATFRHLAVVERQSVTELLASLRSHLEATGAPVSSERVP